MAGIKVVVHTNRLPELARKLPGAVGNIVQAHGEAMADTARRLVPVDTGELKESIEFHMTGETTGELTAGTDHAMFPEFGTVDQAAQPYMRPAVEKETQPFLNDMARLERFLS